MGDGDGDTYRERLEAKLRPEHIRSTLGFAGLYQITHEFIKTGILNDVRELYWYGIRDGKVVYDESGYARDVLAKAPKSKFRASLLWLVQIDAISLAQADRLHAIYAHRHDLSHELIKYRGPRLRAGRESFARSTSHLKENPALLDAYREGYRLI